LLKATGQKIDKKEFEQEFKKTPGAFQNFLGRNVQEGIGRP